MVPVQQRRLPEGVTDHGTFFAGEESNPALTVPEPGTYQHPEQLECGRGGNHPHGRYILSLTTKKKGSWDALDDSEVA